MYLSICKTPARLLSVAALALFSVCALSQAIPPDQPYRAGALLYSENFNHGLDQWKVEMEKPGIVAAKDGVLDLDVPAGVTVWFRKELEGPIMITYEATVISAGGPHDRVSDLNSFWMATDPSSSGDLFAHPRSGKFTDYDSLRMYYVGLGGNGNTTTRFRRYDGTAKPLLPENDISVAQHPDLGITANRTQTVMLIADGQLIQYWRDGRKIFEMKDPAPYEHGWFGIRTTKNHMQVHNVRITRLLPAK